MTIFLSRSAGAIACAVAFPLTAMPAMAQDRHGDRQAQEDRHERAAEQAIDDGDRAPPRGAGREDYGIDGAVDACVGEVQRGNRSVETIDGVNREADGWRVGGRVAGGYGFSCVIDGKGRVKSIEGL